MERYLIGRVELGKTKAGKPVVDLYSTDGRLQYPVLTLFDFSALTDVGIDPNTLGAGPVYKRFWAYYTESDKATSKGNAYKDVQYLEAIDTPATSTSVDSSAILAELRAVRALLQVLAEAQGLTLPDLPDLDGDGQAPDDGGANGTQDAGDLEAAFPRYGDGQALGDNPAEVAAFEQYQAAHDGQAPANVADLRAWFAAHRDNALPAEPSTRGRSKLYK